MILDVYACHHDGIHFGHCLVCQLERQIRAGMSDMAEELGPQLEAMRNKLAILGDAAHERHSSHNHISVLTEQFNQGSLSRNALLRNLGA